MVNNPSSNIVLCTDDAAAGLGLFFQDLPRPHDRPTLRNGASRPLRSAAVRGDVMQFHPGGLRHREVAEHRREQMGLRQS